MLLAIILLLACWIAFQEWRAKARTRSRLEADGRKTQARRVHSTRGLAGLLDQSVRDVTGEADIAKRRM